MRNNKPKMNKFSQKHAQSAFSSKLKQRKCHKIWLKSNLKNRNLQKASPKNKQISIKTSPKTSNAQVFKKKRKSTKKQVKFAGKPQGWQYWSTGPHSYGPWVGHSCTTLKFVTVTSIVTKLWYCDTKRQSDTVTEQKRSLALSTSVLPNHFHQPMVHFYWKFYLGPSIRSAKSRPYDVEKTKI